MTEYECPDCSNLDYIHLGEGELECPMCGCIAGSNFWEVKDDSQK